MELKITDEMQSNWERINKERTLADKPSLNFPLWVKTRNRINAIPQSYNQGTFGERNNISPCGTVACLAGEAIICSTEYVQDGIKLLFKILDDEGNEQLQSYDPAKDIENVAQDLLGLSEAETDIFEADGEGWPTKYYRLFEVAETVEEKAQVAVQFLDYVIETGNVYDPRSYSMVKDNW